MAYTGEDQLMFNNETSTIVAFHHFARILENRVANIEVEFEVQAIRGGIQEKGRMNKIIRPYIEKMRAIEQLIRDMSNRISKMNERDQLDYALKLKNQYVSLTTATINKLKLELSNVKEPDKYQMLRSLLLNVTTLEMLTDDGSEIEGVVNVSKNNKNEKVRALIDASTINYIGSELSIVEFQNRYIDRYVMNRLKEDIFKMMVSANRRNESVDQVIDEMLTLYFDDNLSMGHDQLKNKFVNNEAFTYFVKETVYNTLMKYYMKQKDTWVEDIMLYADEQV